MLKYDEQIATRVDSFVKMQDALMSVHLNGILNLQRMHGLTCLNLSIALGTKSLTGSNRSSAQRYT